VSKVTDGACVCSRVCVCVTGDELV
jgi:hypothetical protein